MEDSQLFIQKLAEKVNIKEVEVSIYFETFVFGFATELQTFKKANFDPFGVFEVEKRLEYIEELEDGGKVLIPPCLQVTFSSSSSISFALSIVRCKLLYHCNYNCILFISL